MKSSESEVSVFMDFPLWVRKELLSYRSSNPVHRFERRERENDSRIIKAATELIKMLHQANRRLSLTGETICLIPNWYFFWTFGSRWMNRLWLFAEGWMDYFKERLRDLEGSWRNSSEMIAPFAFCPVEVYHICKAWEPKKSWNFHAAPKRLQCHTLE